MWHPRGLTSKAHKAQRRNLEATQISQTKTSADMNLGRGKGLAMEEEGLRVGSRESGAPMSQMSCLLQENH